MENNEGGQLKTLDHAGHGERLARTGHAEEGLVAIAGLERGDEFLNRLGLAPVGA